ncbi:MAG TPA: class I SAM-dependent methyltransferase [Candidatus Limnocylindrales bacterium]|nr:class I SAM-dependent methyltransferase [Candidatus Limnocylindrales bacterium]
MTEASAAALARLYDLDLEADPGDLDLYLALAARTGDPVLELAVGTGRIAVPLAAAGHRVVGIDIDEAMLARATARAVAAGADARLEVLAGDVRTVRHPRAGEFGLAILALSSLFLLGDRHEQAAAVHTLAAHLRPGGLAAIDVWLPDAEDLARFDGRLIREWVRRDPATDRVVTKTGSALHDAATGVVRLTTVYEEGHQGEPAVRWVREDRLQLVTADALAGFLEIAGLEVETLAGGYDLEPLQGGSERAVVVARKP